MTGTILELRNDRFGFIASEAYGRPWHLPFLRTAAARDGFDGLRVGQRVRFDQEANPGNPARQRAVRVAPLV